MSLSHGILGFLSYSSMTGYDLAKLFDSSIKFFWYAGANHIYFELNKLEKKEFVSCEYIVQQDKPNKKLYHITDEGKKEFLRWLASDSEDVSKNKNAFLMKVFFSGSSDIDQSIAMLKRFIDDCNAYIDSMNKVPTAIDANRGFVEPLQALYWEFTADYGLRQTKFCIEWAGDCIEKLENFKRGK